eukprot:88123_1
MTFKIIDRLGCSYCSRKMNEYDVEMWTCLQNSPLHRNGYNLCINMCNKTLLCTCGSELICKQKSLVGNYVNPSCGWCGQSIYKSKSNNVWVCKQMDGYCLCSIECERERPDTFCKLSEKWELVPESCLGLSKGYMLLNVEKNDKVPITMDDALNGYMFGLSYHILGENNISTYFYHNAGGTIFELSDAKKGWAQWFDKVNGRPQKCDTLIGNRIDMICNDCNENRLTNVDFEEFKKQLNEELCDAKYSKNNYNNSGGWTRSDFTHFIEQDKQKK